jgi:hypothetical protein
LFNAICHSHFARAVKRDGNPSVCFSICSISESNTRVIGVCHSVTRIFNPSRSGHGRGGARHRAFNRGGASARFGIVLDGWNHASEHYLAVFASYEVNARQKTTLLSMAHCLTPWMTTGQHRATERFWRLWSPAGAVSIRRRGQLLREPATSYLPLVGCASHRLNLAVQADMASHEDDLADVHELMVKPRTLTQSAKLR